MATWAIDEREYARHEARRGRRFAFDRLDPERTALVVIDMVPFFVDEFEWVRSIVPTINSLAAALRGAGGTVAWVVPGDEAFLPARREFFGEEVAERYRRSGGDGAPRARLASSLDHRSVDLFVEKRLPSAFFPGSSALDGELSDREIDTVVVTGTVAEVCCESTARDASALGYRTIFVADANAASSVGVLNATLRTIYRSFGDVRSAADVIERVGGRDRTGERVNEPTKEAK